MDYYNHSAKSDAVIRDSPSLGKAKAVQPLLGKAVKAHPFIHTKDNQSEEEKAIDRTNLPQVFGLLSMRI